MNPSNYSLINLYLVSLFMTTLSLILGFITFGVIRFFTGKYDDSSISLSQTKREVFFLVYNSLLLNANTILWLYMSEWLKFPLNMNLDAWNVFGTTIGLLLWVELFYYCIHRWYHSNRLMKYHAVHHKSVTCQSVTGQAFGFFETITVNCFAPLPYILIGSLFFSLSFYGLCIWAITYYFLSVWLHSNIKFPDRIENTLRKMLIITPMLHSDHHQKFNGNYGLYSTFFDKLFGTLFKQETKSDKI
jgi:lathosterol oxidase